MQVIALASQAQNGKDTVSNYLAKKIGFNRTAFALAVKNVFCEAFGVDMQFIEEWKVRNECPPGFEMPVRKALQFIGDGFRQIQGSIWVDIAFRGMLDRTVISDCRYPNELKRVHNEGGVNILLWRQGHENNDQNKSESYIRTVVDWYVNHGKEGANQEICFDPNTGNAETDMGIRCVDIFLRNEGSVEDLYYKVDQIVVPYLRDVKGWDV
jgi:hypothetical protein